MTSGQGTETDRARVVAVTGEPSPEPRIRHHVFSNPRVLLGAVVVIETAFVVVLLEQNFFFADDFLNLDSARQSGFSPSFLASSVFGHFIPLFNLVNYLLMRTVPFNWSVIVVLDAAMFAAGLLSFYRLLSVVGPRGRYSCVVLTALAGVSILQVPALLWWSNGLSNLPTISLVMLSLDGFCRHEKFRKGRHLVISVGCFVVALGFFESALVILPAVAILWCLFFWNRAADGPFLLAVVRRWRTWLAYGVPGAIDVGYRLLRHAAYPLPAPAGLSALSHFVLTAWSDGFAPSMLGVAYPYRSILGNGPLTVAVGQVLVLGVVVATTVRSRRAWRGWVFFALVYLLVLLGTGYIRVAEKGPNAGIYYDYLLLGPYLFLLGYAFATAPRARDGARTAAAGGAGGDGLRALFDRPRVASARRVALAALLSAAAAASVLSSISIATLENPYEGLTMFQNEASPHLSRLYFETATRSLSAVRSRLSSMTIYDTIVTGVVMGFWYLQFRPDSDAITDVLPWAVFNGSGRSGWILNQYGKIVPATFDVGSSANLKMLSASPGVAVRQSGNGGVCLASASNGSVMIPFSDTGGVVQLPVPLLRLEYSSTTSFTVRPLLVNGMDASDAIRFPPPTVTLLGGTRTVIVDINRLPFADLEIPLPAHADLCISSITVGGPVATSNHP